MGTAEDLVLAEPLGVDGSEQAERYHRVLAVEDVVDQALKVEGVVAVRHDVRRVGRRQPERVRELVRLVGKRRHLCPAKKNNIQTKKNQSADGSLKNGCCRSIMADLLETRLVAELFKVGVVGGDARRVQKLDDARVGQRVEVAAQQQL